MSKVEVKSVQLEDLILDIKNPRTLVYLGERIDPDENKIIEILKEYEDLNHIITSIQTKGWSTLDRPMVIEVGDKYIVKEGNRRVASLKYLVQKGYKILENNQLLVDVVQHGETALNISIDVNHAKNSHKPYNLVQQAVFKARNGQKTGLYYLWQFCTHHDIKDFDKRINVLSTIYDYLINHQDLVKTTLYISISDNSFEYNDSLGAANTLILMEALFNNITKLVKKEMSLEDLSGQIDISKLKQDYELNKLKGINNNLFNVPYVENTPDRLPNNAKHKRSINDDLSFKNSITNIKKMHNKNGTSHISYNILLELEKIKPSKTPMATIVLLRMLLERLVCPHDFLASYKDKLSNRLKSTGNTSLRNDYANTLSEYDNFSKVAHGALHINPTQAYASLSDIENVLIDLVLHWK